MSDVVRVLLVEDNEVYRSSLELLLGLQDGIEVAGSVATAAQAEAVLPELQVDVVLLDFRLPDLDGATAASRLRALDPDRPVLCLTAEASEEERAAVLAAGAVGLIEKGIPIDDLAAAVRAAVRSRPDSD